MPEITIIRLQTSLLRALVAIFLCVALSGCVGTVVGAAVDTAVEVIKIPFKVGGAVIDVVTPDEFLERDADQNKLGESEAAALQQESGAL